MEEEWRDINGYEGYYQVSNMGRVRSMDVAVPHPRPGHLSIKKGKVRKQFLDGKKHYLTVGLHRDAVTKTLNVHRLVANAFIPNPLNLPQVNHIDEIKINNEALNLEWCSASYNMKHGGAVERQLFSRYLNNSKEDLSARSLVTKFAKQSRNCERPVIQISGLGFFIAEFTSASSAGRTLGVDRANIQSCCKGRARTCGGFKWEYKNKKENE